MDKQIPRAWVICMDSVKIQPVVAKSFSFFGIVSDNISGLDHLRDQVDQLEELAGRVRPLKPLTEDDTPIVEVGLAGNLELQNWKIKHLVNRIDRVIDHLQSSL
jgi:hypothetical protein